MLKPSIDELLGKTDSRFKLVIASAKRARILTNHEDKEALDKYTNHKNIGKALEEILEDKVIIIDGE